MQLLLERLNKREPDKARAATRNGVSRYRQREPDKARAATRKGVSRFRQREPSKARAATKEAVSRFRQREPDKARAATKEAVSRYRQREPDKALTSTRGSVYKYYYKDWENLAFPLNKEYCCIVKKNRVVNNRYWVAKCYFKCLQRNRSLSQVSTAKQYNKDIESNRRKSKYASRIFYRKNAPIISRQRRDSYFLAEPRQQKITCLLKVFQDIFYSKKKIRSQIMKVLTVYLHTK